ncbi:MAG: thioredoxin domain-containing protein [Lewinellaceae bacterium]|nr:thioredoxin domain-containing protein [Lewinellaceae bacterium]
MKEKLSVPIAIIVAGVVIALAIIVTKGSGPLADQSQQGVNDAAQVQADPSLDQVAEVISKDHIKGNINAKVKIIEYSDFECPFCKRFHSTMNQVMDEYGESGDVAWVYRQFPLDSLHPEKARLEAATSECVAEIGGNDAFWVFADAFFAVTPSNNQTDVAVVLPEIISNLGLSQEKIDECVSSGRYDQDIQDDINNALATGGRGTPWSIIVTESGEKYPINGAQPYAGIKALIDIALE